MLEHVNERCLAYACFTRYEDHLALATQSHLQIIVEPGESCLAAHDLAGELSRWIQYGPLCGSSVTCSYELVTPLRERLNESRFARPVAQHLPDFQNVLSDTFRIDICLRPQRFQKLVLAHQAVGVFDQITQYIERLGSKGARSLPRHRQWFTVSSRKDPNAFMWKFAVRIRERRGLECDFDYRWICARTESPSYTRCSNACPRASTKIGLKRIQRRHASVSIFPYYAAMAAALVGQCARVFLDSSKTSACRAQSTLRIWQADQASSARAIWTNLAATNGKAKEC